MFKTDNNYFFSRNHVCWIALFLLTSISSLHAQNSVNTNQVNRVYSRYGIGVVSPEVNIRGNAMGKTGLATPSQFSINWTNPALLSFNSAVSFEFNVEGDFRSSLDAEGTEYADNETSITSIRFSLPVWRNKWQTSFGIRPYTRINYSFVESELVGPAADSMYNLNRSFGQGAINQVSWKNGVRVAKNLHLGLDLSYYFGNVFGNNISYIRSETGPNRVLPDVQGNYYSVATGSKITQEVQFLNYKGLSSTLGVSYIQQFDSLPFDLFLGATYDAYAQMNSNLETHLHKPASIDSSTNTGVHSMPTGLGTGVGFVLKDSLGYQRYMIEANFVSKKYNSIQNNRLGIGIEKLPNPNNNKVLSQNLIRFGGYFSQNAVLYKNQGLDEFGITFGFGIPKKRADSPGGPRSIFDFGFTAGQHGSNENGGIKESFIRLNLGITFNDRWFQQIRIN